MSISSINSNIAALSAQANISRASDNASASIARLSSGNRIVKSSDDVAGLAIGTSLATQVTGLKAALNNANQASSLLQVADGALAQINNILQQQKSLALQAGSGSLSDTDRGFLDQQFQGLTQQIDQIAGSTNFNGVNLLSGVLGANATLVNTSALAGGLATATATASDGMTSGDSINAVQAFSTLDGSDLSGTGATGDVDFTESDGATLISDGAMLNLNSAINGKFSNWQLSNVVYTTSATLSVQIGGLTFSGTVADTDQDATLQNGNTYIHLDFSAPIDLTDAGTVASSAAQVSTDYKDTAIYRTNVVSGLDFTGTRLAGTTGSGTNGGIAMVRTIDGSKADISNFRAISSGVADSTELAVDINGHTLRAVNVTDAVNTGDVIQFDDGQGDVLQLDFTGLTTNFTDMSGAAGDHQQLTDFLSALNTSFARRGGSGATFAIGSGANSTINVAIGSVTSNSLYNGQSLSIGSAASATTASTALDSAINSLSAVQSGIGALESRFNFASANIQSTIQNEDAARGQFLDTDVSSESTAYATSQVQLQAGIAVLAQANLLPQNLLKLIQ